MAKIKYCKAIEFLENNLPEELSYKIQTLTGGGKRVMLFWSATKLHFQEFGRSYLNETNTNETHYSYVETTLERAYKSLKKRNIIPSFTVDQVLSETKWYEKDKPSIRENYS